MNVISSYDNHQAVESWLKFIRYHSNGFFRVIMRQVARKPFSMN